ncbi:MAG: ScaI family restriction endonuclease [Patescibacteria group bacterium]
MLGYKTSSIKKEGNNFMHNSTPYKGKPTSEWLSITKNLIEAHPLNSKDIVSIVQRSWDQIFSGKIGGVIKIGEEITLTPQMVGNFLHVLVAHNLSTEAPKLWRIEATTDEKDIVYIPDSFFSFEMKSSSSKNDIYGNRSYGQQLTNANSKKSEGWVLSLC